MEVLLIGMLTKIGTGSLFGFLGVFILINEIFLGWCVMKILSLIKDKNAMSKALEKKQDREWCIQVHRNQARHMEDLKNGNAEISRKLDGLINVLLEAKMKEG